MCATPWEFSEIYVTGNGKIGINIETIDIESPFFFSISLYLSLSLSRLTTTTSNNNNLCGIGKMMKLRYSFIKCYKVAYRSHNGSHLYDFHVCHVSAVADVLRI